MMKLLLFIIGFFSKNKPGKSVYDEAVCEGIRDTLKEMGYPLKENEIKH